MTREFRMTARDLPIYDRADDDKHVFFVIAKVESGCDAIEELRATTAVNDFIRERRRAGVRLDMIPGDVVDSFKSRVQRRVYYVPLHERHEYPPPPTNTRRKRPIVSSSDPENALTPKTKFPPKTTKVPRKGQTKPRASAASQKPAAVTPKSSVVDPAASQSVLDVALPVVDDVPPPSSVIVAEGQGLPSIDAESLQASLARLVSTPPVPTPPRQQPQRDPSTSANKSQGFNCRTDDISNMLIRIESMDRRIERRHARIADGLKYLVKKIEKADEDLKEVKDALKNISGHVVAAELAAAFTFPLQTPEEVDEYVEKEPKLTTLISR